MWLRISNLLTKYSGNHLTWQEHKITLLKCTTMLCASGEIEGGTKVFLGGRLESFAGGTRFCV